MKSIGVFLSSLTPKLNLDNDLDILAGFISESKLKLVYGGGKRGLMGKLSKKVSNKNGKIKGITLPMFDNEKIKPNYLDEEEVQTNFYLRKKSLIDQSDFFVVMPGGVGTADEFFDVFNHLSLNLIDKNIFIFNKNDCWTDILKWLEKNVELGMLPSITDKLFVADTIEELIKTIKLNEF